MELALAHPFWAGAFIGVAVWFAFIFLEDGDDE